MIPVILGAIGGYLIGTSTEKELFSKGGTVGKKYEVWGLVTFTNEKHNKKSSPRWVMEQNIEAKSEDEAMEKVIKKLQRAAKKDFGYNIIVLEESPLAVLQMKRGKSALGMAQTYMSGGQTNSPLKVKYSDFHRNGISGLAFHVVVFDWDEKGEELQNLVAFVFDEPGAISVVKIDDLNNNVLSNADIQKFRGDYFENSIRNYLNLQN